MIDTLVDCGWQINWAKSDLVLSHEKEFIGFRIDLVHGGQGRIRLSESRSDRIVHQIGSLYNRRSSSPRGLASWTGGIVSGKSALGMVALLFTKHSYAWIQIQCDIGGWETWDKDAVVPELVKGELRVWKLHFEEWNGSAIWVTGDPSWVQAQDASDRAVGGWIGIFSGTVPMSVKGREIPVSWPDPIVRAARSLEQHDRAESSTYRELWDILFMFESFGHIMQDSWVI